MFCIFVFFDIAYSVLRMLMYSYMTVLTERRKEELLNEINLVPFQEYGDRFIAV